MHAFRFPALFHHKILSPLLAASLASVLMLGAGCVHKVDIHQGNLISAEQVEKLELGMSREQVIGLLGSPLLTDPFHVDRWDYFTWSKTGRKEEIRRQRLTLLFKGDQLAEIK